MSEGIGLSWEVKPTTDDKCFDCGEPIIYDCVYGIAAHADSDLNSDHVAKCPCGQTDPNLCTCYYDMECKECGHHPDSFTHQFDCVNPTLKKRILITGSRNWTDRDMMYRILEASYEPGIVLIQGEAPGADRMAKSIWKSLGGQVESYPAHWKVNGKMAGHIRNQQMVDSGADLCIAFPTSESRGTWDCVRRATEAGIPVMTIYSEHRQVDVKF